MSGRVRGLVWALWALAFWAMLPQVALARPVSIDPFATFHYALRWYKPVVRTGFDRRVGVSFAQPVISHRDAIVAVGTAESQIQAFALEGGRRRWSYEHDSLVQGASARVVRSSGSDGSTEELFVFGGLDGRLLALRARDGTFAWASELDGIVRAPPRQVGLVLYLATSRNNLYAIDVREGKVLWTQGRPPPSGLTVDGHAAVAYDADADAGAGVVVTCFSDGYATAHKASDGARLWERPLSLQHADFVDADADPVIRGAVVYMASYSDGVFALSLRDGQVLWRHPLPAATRLAVTDAFLIAASADGHVWGLDFAQGTPVFHTRIPPGPISRMRVVGDHVAFAAGESGLVVLAAASGKPVQATAVGGGVGADLGEDGAYLALLSAAGYLYVFAAAAPGMVMARVPLLLSP